MEQAVVDAPAVAQALAGRVTRYPISISRMTYRYCHPSYHYPISHIDIQDDHIEMVDNHIDMPYPKSITHISYRFPYRCIIHVRSPVSISHIDIGSYIVTLLAGSAVAAAAAAADTAMKKAVEYEPDAVAAAAAAAADKAVEKVRTDR